MSGIKNVCIKNVTVPPRWVYKPAGVPLLANRAFLLKEYTYVKSNPCVFTVHTYISTSKAAELNYFKINSIFKGKCLQNAEIFNRKLRRIPLIKIGKNGPRTMLKGELSKNV